MSDNKKKKNTKKPHSKWKPFEIVTLCIVVIMIIVIIITIIGLS